MSLDEYWVDDQQLLLMEEMHRKQAFEEVETNIADYSIDDVARIAAKAAKENPFFLLKLAKEMGYDS